MPVEQRLRRLSRASLLAVATALLAACGSGHALPSSPAPALSKAPSASAQNPAPAASARAQAKAAASKQAARQPVKIEFAMDWILPTEYFYLAVADQKGYYKDEGIQVHLNEGSGSANAVKIVGAGTEPIGLADAAQILPGRIHGIPVKSIMSL
ncbi:MAG: ABC transporter substrate-binding protein, partial [Candidatus Saccharimonadales bacterium]